MKEISDTGGVWCSDEGVGGAELLVAPLQVFGRDLVRVSRARKFNSVNEIVVSFRNRFVDQAERVASQTIFDALEIIVLVSVYIESGTRVVDPGADMRIVFEISSQVGIDAYYLPSFDAYTAYDIQVRR